MKTERIIVVSDTHSYHNLMEHIVKNEPHDLVFHLGDSQISENELSIYCNGPVAAVRGNCDIRSELPNDRIIELYGRRIMLTHGHMYGAKAGHSGLLRKARVKNADTVLYGHTHVPLVKKEGDVLVANPGSLTYPRNGGPSYIIMSITEDGEINIEIKRLETC